MQKTAPLGRRRLPKFVSDFALCKAESPAATADEMMAAVCRAYDERESSR